MQFLKLIPGIGLLILSLACGQTEVLETNNLENSNLSVSNISKSEPTRVNYCELVKDLEKYDGQTIFLKGVYMRRFEVSSFFSFSCEPEIRIVAKFDAPPCGEKSEIEEWDSSSAMTDRAHGVVIKGRFENKIIKGQSTGEPAQFYRFNTDCIDKIKQLGTMDVSPKSKAEIVKKRIEQFESE